MRTMINIKVDKETKDEAKKVSESIGIPLSTIINAYLKQFARTKEVYFSAPEGTLKISVRKRLTGLHKDIVEGKHLSKKFTDPKEMDSYLRAL